MARQYRWRCGADPGVSEGERFLEEVTATVFGQATEVPGEGRDQSAQTGIWPRPVHQSAGVPTHRMIPSPVNSKPHRIRAPRIPAPSRSWA